MASLLKNSIDRLYPSIDVLIRLIHENEVTDTINPL
jgi:hypothetical protein